MTATCVRCVLVTAANGQAGSRVARVLEGMGIAVRRGTPDGRIPFDWDRPATWDAALRGMDAVCIASQSALGAHATEGSIRALVYRAVHEGVGKLVMLGGRCEAMTRCAERIVRDSGLAWTVIRSAWFNQNFSETAIAEMIKRGTLALPDPGRPEPFVDADDVAEVVAETLVDPVHNGRTYTLKGPELLTFAQIARKLSEAIGFTVEYEPVAADTFRAAVRKAGASAETADSLALLCEQVRAGGDAHGEDGVLQVLGRSAKPFDEYAELAASLDAWGSLPVTHGRG